MLQEINGNLLNFPCNINIIVHQTNCQNTFGAGIALQIAKKYPKAYEADKKYYDDLLHFVTGYEHSDAMLGTISHACVHDELERYVVNLYAQNLDSKIKRATNYEAFSKGLEQLAKFCNCYPQKIEPIVGFPKFIGCGLGGGSWNVIKAMLEDFQSETNYKVYIVNFQTQAASASTQIKMA